MAAIHSIQNSAEIENLIQQYKRNINFMPQWITDYANSDEIFEDEYDYTIRFNQMVLDHINDENIADILKTLLSQNFK